MGKSDEWRVAPMQASDLKEVMAIERASHPTAWPEALFLGELDLAWSRLLLLRDFAGVLLGYIDFWLVHDELHVLNVAVAPAARRQGCGSHLLEVAIDYGIERGAEYVTLEVRSENEGAIELYRQRGFDAVGLRKKYYADTGEDAVVMALEL